MQNITLDLLYTLRLFRRHAGPVILVSAALAVTVGVVAIGCSVADAMLFQGAGVTDPASVVRIRRTFQGGVTAWPFREYLSVREARLTTAEPWFARQADWGLKPDESLGTVTVHLVAPSFFNTFGASPALGRLLRTDDDGAAVPPVLVNHRFWEQRLGTDRDIVGASLFLEGKRLVVAGVLRRGFIGPILPTDNPPAFWITLGTAGRLWPDRGPLTFESEIPVNLAGRLQPEASMRQAEAELQVMASRLASNRAAASHVGVIVEPVRERDARIGIGVLILLSGVVVIAYLNLANLQLASAKFRRSETAIRMALGASRSRLILQALLEGAALSVPAAVTGSVLAYRFLPLFASALGVGDTVDVTPQAPSIAVIGLLTVAAVLAGALPQLSTWATSTQLPVTTGPRHSISATVARRSIMIQAGASATFVLLAALFARAFVHVARFDFGFDVNRLVEAAGASGQTSSGIDAAYWAEAIHRVRELPGVDAVALAAQSPLTARITPAVHENRTSPGFFDVMGFRVLRGRSFTDEDCRTNATVAVITSSVAGQFWSNENPLGASLGRVNRRLADVVVIGIIPDAATNRIGLPNPGMVYRPLVAPGPRDVLVVRAHGEGISMVRPLRDALGGIDPTVRLRVWPLSHYYLPQLGYVKAVSVLAGGLALLSTILAVIGVAGVTALAVARREHEIAIRLAVGATHAQVLRLVLRDALRPALFGLAVGLVVVVVGGRFVAAVLYGISPLDPIALAVGATILLLSITLAALGPAWRASRLDPAVMLRQT